MAFNVQENAVFIPEFSEISLCPPPPRWKIIAIYASECILLNCIIISVHPNAQSKGWGGGGGGDTKGHFFFSASKIAKSYKS